MVLRRQLHSPPFPETRRAAAQIDDHVEDATGGDAYQLALGALGLKVQPAQGPLRRPAVIVLHEDLVYAGGGEFLLLPRLEKESAGIAEYLRLDQNHISNGCVLKFHGINASLLRVFF